MANYGMKDASNLILVNKATGQPELYIDYANATTSEWSSDAVYATKKGVNAIRWDSARSGTLTVDTELFDLSLLALLMGSDVESGEQDIMHREAVELGPDKSVKINTDGVIDPSTITVFRLDRVNDTEHASEPVYNATEALNRVPEQVTGLVVTPSETSASITFSPANGADEYIVKRDGTEVAQVATTSYTDGSVSADSEYTYTVTAVNAYGEGPASAQVTVQTTAGETGTPVEADRTAIENASRNQGNPRDTAQGEVSYTFDNNTITFSDSAREGQAYAIYFADTVATGRKITIKSDKFAGNYEIFADAQIREQETGVDQLMQIHYFNAKPQSNFTLTQSATEPASLSIVFDLLPQGEDLAEFRIID